MDQQKEYKVVIKKYKGSFNYYLVNHKDKNLKTYHFQNKTKREVNLLRQQFSNPITHNLVGEKVVRDKKDDI